MSMSTSVPRTLLLFEAGAGVEMKVVLKMLRFSQSLFCAMVRASVKTIERKPHLHFKLNKRVVRPSINFSA